jgi:thiol-disulfide isomerase/thioredoxin
MASVSSLVAQNVKINVVNSTGKAALHFLSGEKSVLVDSISVDNYTYQFNLGSNHSGFYRLIFNNKKWLDFIYDGEDIEIEVDVTSKNVPYKIIKSDENKIYYDFIALNKDFKTKSELLTLVLNNYPDNDTYLQATKETLLKLQEEYLYYVNITAQSKPGSFISKYILSAQLPIIDASLRREHQLNYLKSLALDKVDFTNDELIYSDVFTNKTIEYLSYYRNPQLPMEFLEKEFKVAVDTILNKAKVNDIVYKHITEYLLDGFKKFGFDNVINYIIDNYVVADEICLEEKLETSLERRINQNKIFKPGYSVPDISLYNDENNIFQLSKIQSEKILIIFYATWCPHCKTLLPQISELYKNQKTKDVEVIAVSIDTSHSDWESFISTINLEWINVREIEGWEGKSVKDYYIYATPTMFLVDENKKLIKIVNELEELIDFYK